MTQPVANETLALSRYRPQIEAALSYADATHTYEDVAEMVAAGALQFWPGPASCIVTELISFPRKRVLHFFLAAGKMSELQGLADIALDWGRTHGCGAATLFGRRGWERSFLRDSGWQKSKMILMERSLVD